MEMEELDDLVELGDLEDDLADCSHDFCGVNSSTLNGECGNEDCESIVHSESSESINAELQPPLMSACYHNNAKYVMEAISKGKDLNLKDKAGFTLLHYAAEAGSIDVLNLLMNQHLIDLNVGNRCNETPLHWAVLKCNNPEVINILIKAGADINLVNCYNHTPLFKLFCRNRRNFKMMIEMGQILLENGANVHIKQVLITAVEEYTLLTKNEYNDWLNFVCMFLYYGADVNLRNNFDHCAFSLAMQLECNELCSIMLPYVTNFNMIFKLASQMNTLFLIAVKHKSPDVFYMIEHGADINFSNGRESCLQLSMNHSLKLFEYIFTHCKNETILKESAFMIKLRSGYIIKNNFLRCINLIFEHKLVEEIFTYSPSSYIHLDLIHDMINLNISIEDQIKFLYLLLSYDNHLNTVTLRRLFYLFSFDDRFEVLMRVTIVLDSFITYGNHYLRCLCAPDECQPKMEINKFPSLQVLSRNCFRKNIRKDLIYTSNRVYFKYYNYLLKLEVPTVIKDVLSLKRLI